MDLKIWRCETGYWTNMENGFKDRGF